MKIPILHLEEGFHQLEEIVRGGSLSFSGYSVYPNDILVKAEVSRFEQNIRCKTSVQTEAQHECDRCLQKFVKNVVTQFELIFTLDREGLQTNEESVVPVTAETVDISLDPWIIEHLILELPMQVFCREDCKGLCAGCGENLNEAACSCEAAPTDPRWDKLKDLLK